MPAPSPLAIATGSLNRLVKEEQSYYKELEKQQTRLQKLKEGADEDGNKEYMIKQEVRLSPPQSPITLFY
jgi:tubulin-specific chaperone A